MLVLKLNHLCTLEALSSDAISSWSVNEFKKNELYTATFKQYIIRFSTKLHVICSSWSHFLYSRVCSKILSAIEKFIMHTSAIMSKYGYVYIHVYFIYMNPKKFPIESVGVFETRAKVSKLSFHVKGRASGSELASIQCTSKLLYSKLA